MEETRDHFWKCNAASGVEWRPKCYRAMRDCLVKLDTAAPLQQLFLEKLRSQLYSDITPVHVHPEVAHVAASQDEIGWGQLLKGRFTKQWGEFQNAYLGSKATTCNNGTTWLTSIIDAFLKQWWQLWESRNQDRHGKDKDAQNQATKAQAIRDLQIFYDTYQDKVLPEHQYLFTISIHERM
jgi:hypothetical protein